MKKMKLNIQLFNSSVAIQTITETTDIDTNQSTFSIPAKMTTTGATYNNSNASMTMQWKYASASSWTSLSKQTFGIGKSSSKTRTWTLTLTHNNDGTLEDINFRVKWYITDSTNGTTGATTYTPTTIPRGSEFDTLNWNRDTQILLNSTISIPAIQHISPAYHKLEARFMYNSAERLIATWTGVSITNGYISFSFNSSQLSAIYNYMPSQTTHYIRMYLYTYSDSSYSTQIGEESAIWWTGLIPSSVVPTASMSYSEGGDVPNSWGVYVKGKSKLNITLIGIGAYGSTINSHSISGNGYTYNSNTALTNYLSSSGNITFTGVVSDTRQRQGSTSFVVNVLDYYNPSIATAQVQRCDADGNIDNNGEYMYISYGASISSCNNKNSSVYKVGYRVHNTGDYTYVNLTTNANSYSANGMLFSDGIKAASATGTKVQFSSSNTYDIQFYVADYFTEYTNLQSLDTGFDLMNFNASGKAMAIGKVSEANANQELFEVGIDTIIDGDLSVNKVIYGGATIQAQNPTGETDIICKDQNGNFIYLYAGANGHGIYDNIYGGIIFANGGGKHLEGNWIVDGSLKSKNICICQFAGSMTFTETWTYYKIPLQAVDYNNAYFIISSSSFYVPANVSVVKVQFFISWYQIDNGSDKNFVLYKNNSQVTSLAYVNYGTGAYYCNASGMAIVSVSQGDALSIWCSSGTAGNMRIFGSSSRMSVEIIA